MSEGGALTLKTVRKVMSSWGQCRSGASLPTQVVWEGSSLSPSCALCPRKKDPWPRIPNKGDMGTVLVIGGGSPQAQDWWELPSGPRADLVKGSSLFLPNIDQCCELTEIQRQRSWIRGCMLLLLSTVYWVPSQIARPKIFFQHMLPMKSRTRIK